MQVAPAPAPKKTKTPLTTSEKVSQILDNYPDQLAVYLPMSLQEELMSEGPTVPIVTETESFLGEREGVGTVKNPIIQKIFKKFSINQNQDSYPWCASFVSYALSKVGRPTNTHGSRAFLKQGKATTTPAKGDIVVMWNDNPKTGGKTGYGGHVGIYLSETSEHVLVLSGNADDSVTVTAFKKERVLGYRDLGTSSSGGDIASVDIRFKQIDGERKLIDYRKLWARHAELEAKHNAGTATGKDMYEARSIVEEVGLANPKSFLAVHGGAEGITSFDAERIKSQAAGAGFYFSTDIDGGHAENYAEKSGGIVYRVALTLNNPYYSSNNYLSPPANDPVIFDRSIESIGKSYGLNSEETSLLKEVFSGYSPSVLTGTHEFTYRLSKFVGSEGFNSLNKWQQAGIQSTVNTLFGKNGAQHRLNEIRLLSGHDGIVYKDGSVATSLSPYKIKSVEPFTGVPLSERFNQESPDIRFKQIEDAAYMEAVESGDVEAQQRMVDEAAKAAGYTTKGHHGSPNFRGNEFKSGNFGPLFFFAKDRAYAEYYATRFENAKNPTLLDVWLKVDNAKQQDEVVQEGVGLAKETRREGFDAIETPNAYVVFMPDQIKSADPVTRDEQGNVIPLSERFNQETPDIRFKQIEDAPVVATEADFETPASVESYLQSITPEGYTNTIDAEDFHREVELADKWVSEDEAHALVNRDVAHQDALNAGSPENSPSRDHAPEAYETYKALLPKGKVVVAKDIEQRPATQDQVDLQNQIAKMYEALPEDGSADPEVPQAYANLAKEVLEQYSAIQDAGITLEVVDDSPYNSSSEMIDAVKSGVLQVQGTDAKTFGDNAAVFEDGTHPMLQDTGLVDLNGRPMLVNDVFRGVHDYIAHAAFGSSFGPIGEESAWRAHLETIKDPLARRAITTETRGQNSWVNYSDSFLRDGVPIKKGQPGFVNPVDRPFATQKYALLPESALEQIGTAAETPTTSPETEQPLRDLLDNTVTGNVSKERLAQFRANPEIKKSTLSYLEAAAKSMWNSLQKRFDTTTAVQVDRLASMHATLRDGTRSTVKHFDPNNPEETRQMLFPDVPLKVVTDQDAASKVSAVNDASRVGTAKMGTKVKPRETTQESNINGAHVSDALLVKQMKTIDYAHLPADIRKESDPYAKRDKFVEWLKTNLLALHDAFPEAVRTRATHWYDGANRIASEFASDYNTTVEQAGGVLAVLSPQKDWFMNVTQAKQVMGIWKDHQDTKLDMDLIGEEYEVIIANAQAPKVDIKKEKSGETELAKTRRINANERLHQKARDARRSILEGVVGKTISELDGDPYLQGWAIRVAAQSLYGRDYPTVSPEGDFLEVAVTTDGVNQKNGWGSIGEIKKAVRILKDGSLENISENLGNEHKVRNFYNNIVAPNSPKGDATIDTHAVAAGHLLPMGSSAKEVKHNFGTSGSSAASVGVSGTYHMYMDAYTAAAAERGLQPRQMQSIVWEAVRQLYSPNNRRNKKFVAAARASWQTSSDEQFRKSLLEGGISSPVWARTNTGGKPSGEPGRPQEKGDSNDTGGDLPNGDRAASGIDIPLKLVTDDDGNVIFKHSAFADIRHGEKTHSGRVEVDAEITKLRKLPEHENTPEDELRVIAQENLDKNRPNWFSRMFTQRDDLRRPISAIKEDIKALKTVIDTKLKKLNKLYDKAMKKEKPEIDLVNQALGNSSPLLTPSAEHSIQVEFDTRMETANEIGLTEIADAAGVLEEEIRVAENKDTLRKRDSAKKKANDKYKLVYAEFTGKREDAINEVAQWEQDTKSASMFQEAESRRNIQSSALEILEATKPLTYKWVTRMRDTTDEFSERLSQWYKEDRPSLSTTIDRQNGVYLVRSYRFHQDPAMASMLLDAKDSTYEIPRDELTAFFKEKIIDIEVEKLKKLPEHEHTPDSNLRDVVSELDTTNDYAATMFQDFIKGHEGSYMSGQNSGIKTETERFLRQMNLPPAIENVLETIEDPWFNANQTLTSVSGILFSQMQLAATKKAGLEMGTIITEAQKKANNKYSKWVSVVGTGALAQAYAPLDGYFTSPENKEAWDAAFNNSKKMQESTAGKAFNQLNSTMLGLAGTSLGIVTLGNPGFYTRNLVGTALVGLAQGVNPFSKSGVKSWKTAYNSAMGSEVDQETEEYIEELTALRVLGDGVHVSYLNDLFTKYNENPNAALEWIKGKGVEVTPKLLTALKSGRDGWGKFMGGLEATAEITETWVNAAIFEAELDALKRAKIYDTELEAKQEAARRVKMVTSSKSETSQGVKGFSEISAAALIAPFIRFKTEMFRTIVNTYKLGFQDFNRGRAEKNDVLRNHGMRRLGAAGVIHGGLTVAMPIILQNMMGIDKEEDEAIRAAMPEYAKNTSFWYFMDKENGKLRTLDLTYTNLFSFPLDVLTQTLMSGDVTKIPEIAGRFVSQEFLGENIAAGAMVDVSRNLDESSGLPIWLEVDDFSTKIMKASKHLLLGAYTPALGKKLFQAGQAVHRPPSDEDGFLETPLGVVLGMALPTKVRVHRLEDLASRAYRNIAKENRELWQITAPIMSSRGISDGDVAKLVKAGVSARVKVWSKANRIHKAYNSMGLTTPQQIPLMTNSGLSKDRSLKAIRGITDRPIFPSKRMLKLRKDNPDTHATLVRETRKYPRYQGLD